MGVFTELGVAHAGLSDSCRAAQSPGGGRSLPPLPTSPSPPSRLLTSSYRQDEHRWVPNLCLSSGSCRKCKVDEQEHTERNGQIYTARGCGGRRTRERDVQLALPGVSTARGGGSQKFADCCIALQLPARQQGASPPVSRRSPGKGLRQGAQGVWTRLGTGVVVLHLLRWERPKHPPERDDTALREKQQAAAPYLAPVPVRGSILWAQGACAWGRARGPNGSGRCPHAAGSGAAHPGPGVPGGLISRPRRRWECAAAGARDAGER